MKDIEILDILTLNDGLKYVVSSETKIDDKIYYMIVGLDDKANIKFVEKSYINNEIHLTELNDKILINTLLPLFYKNGVEALKNVNLDKFTEK